MRRGRFAELTKEAIRIYQKNVDFHFETDYLQIISVALNIRAPFPNLEMRMRSIDKNVLSGNPSS